MSGVGLITYGTSGSGTGQFDWPHAVAIGPEGRIYIADYGNARVVRINDMDGTGWTAVYGTFESGFFDSPSGVAVDSGGNIYVTDRWNDRIVKFPDSNFP
jgi:DNA-binding beta-propeller fold protein YncE